MRALVLFAVQMIHREYHNVYSEVDGLSTLLGYKTSNAGCCKVRLGAEDVRPLRLTGNDAWFSTATPAMTWTACRPVCMAQILLHPEWGTSVYPASLFAKAPLETVQEAIKHAAAASGQKHPVGCTCCGSANMPRHAVNQRYD